MEAGVDNDRGTAVVDPGTHCGTRPPRPPPSGGNDGLFPTYFFVLTTVSGLDEAGVPAGFDVDCIESRCDEPVVQRRGACAPPSDAGVPCDEPGGVDNQTSRVISKFGVIIKPPYDALVKLGRRALVLAVAGYSGEPNDSEVIVSLFPAEGNFEANDCDSSDAAAALEAGTLRPPLFNGCDRYSMNPAFVAANTLPKGVDGYVVDHHLVIDGNELAGTLAYGDLFFPVRARYLDATLKRGENGALDIERGVMGGYVVPGEVMRGLGKARIADSRPLCEEAAWEDFRAQFCRALDLPGEGASASSTEPCGAASFGVALTGKGVRAGSERPFVENGRCDNVDAAAFRCGL